MNFSSSSLKPLMPRVIHFFIVTRVRSELLRSYIFLHTSKKTIITRTHIFHSNTMSNRKSTTSPIRKDDDEFLNSLVQETTVETVINNNQKLFFFFVALISTWLPSYLYQGVKGLEFSGLSILLFLIVSNAAAYVLYLGYLNIFIRTKPTYVQHCSLFFALVIFCCCGCCCWILRHMAVVLTQLLNFVF